MTPRLSRSVAEWEAGSLSKLILIKCEYCTIPNLFWDSLDRHSSVFG